MIMPVLCSGSGQSAYPVNPGIVPLFGWVAMRFGMYRFSLSINAYPYQ